jgi:hypothetical protein
MIHLHNRMYSTELVFWTAYIYIYRDGAIPSFSWSAWGKLQNILCRISVLDADIGIWKFACTKQKGHHDVRLSYCCVSLGIAKICVHYSNSISSCWDNSCDYEDRVVYFSLLFELLQETLNGPCSSKSVEGD